MSLSRRSSRLAPASALLIGLLLLMVGLSSVLAYQALDAARSEARSAERTLRVYASSARLELSRRGDEMLSERLRAAASSAWEAANAREEAPPALAKAEAAVRREMRWCNCEDAVQGVFRVDAGGGAWTLSSRGMRPEVRAAVTGVAAQVDGAADSVTLREARVGGGRQLLVYRVRRLDGGAVRAYGFALDPRRVVGPVLSEVLAGAPILDDTLRPGMTNRNAIAVVVTAASGEVVYRSPATIERDAHWMDAKVGSIGQRALPPGAVVEELGGALAGLTAQVSVRPELLADRVGEGAPESRSPLLFAVFGLTLVLFGIAVVQLRRQQELVRLRDDFVSGVSHELRTPLAQIRLFADLLESGRLGDPARARSVRIINEESRRLTYLVENILHFSRAQRDAMRLSPAPVDVGALVREVVDGFAPLAHHVEFATRVEPGVVARIDRDAFRQVLLNLLDNAAKYGPRGGVVQVGMAVVGFSLRIWITDSGPGVPREARARIWEPYRRLDREADAAVGGSGIGLAVVKDVVSLHGGRVWVEDARGGGARFVVEIPGATYAGPPGEGEPAPAAESVEAGAR